MPVPRPASNLAIDGQRLWDTLNETAAFGGTAKGGVRRLTLTAEDAAVRAWFARAASAAGATVTTDALGNQVARRSGRAAVSPIAVGSHLDTQPTGGRFDGILGVLAGLEILRTLQDADYATHAPIEVINWTNEEGSRFAPAMLGSAVFSGRMTPEEAWRATDREGVAVREALESIGALGPESPLARPLTAFLELHIEQGPVLETEGRTIGVVTGAQGVTWLRIAVTGFESHAGTTPMDRRRDALAAAAELILAAETAARAAAGVATVGTLEIASPSINVIPGALVLTADLRHPEAEALAAMEAALREAAEDIARARHVDIAFQPLFRSAPVAFHPEIVAAVEGAAERSGLPWRRIVSGAGHDAVNVAAVAPAGMIFIPCRDGISHNESESATPEDCAAGAQLLLEAVLELDRRLAGSTG